MSLLSSYDISDWEPKLDPSLQESLLEHLEKGKVIYLPKLTFTILPSSQYLLNPKFLAQGTKNISYNPATQVIRGINEQLTDKTMLTALMRDFSVKATHLIQSLFPHYQESLQIGRTSFRPAEILNRKSSYRKDDTLLHVDAFPSTPMRGQRILRVFCNVNPQNKPRRWHLGEPFKDVIQRFAPKVNAPLPGTHAIMNLLGVTKQKRSLYDHYMLNIHHKMKRDQKYQKKAIQEKMAFPANTTWIVFTDLVSHAALTGQHLLEQTFYVPADAQYYPDWAPVRQLENFLERPLL